MKIIETQPRPRPLTAQEQKIIDSYIQAGSTVKLVWQGQRCTIAHVEGNRPYIRGDYR